MIRAGGAVLPLRPRSKRPRESNWTELPRLTWREAQNIFGKTDNIGVRLGKWSKLPEGYLHAIDFDLTDPESKDEALAALGKIVGEIEDFDIVDSGSGAGSMHLYFVTDQPLRTATLTRSRDSTIGHDNKKHSKWEIAIGGTGRQFVLPPSIHPLTRQPYRWRDAPDFERMLFIPSDDVKGWYPHEPQRTQRDEDEMMDGLDEAIANAPLGFPIEEVRGIIDTLCDHKSTRETWIEDRDGWLQMASPSITRQNALRPASSFGARPPV